jgi:uncharacterized tellurite resistance protein B-like protein
MGEKFTQEEQIAIANVLFNLVHADFNSRLGEDDCLKVCLDEMGFDAQGFVPVPRNELPSQSYETLRRMNKEKKRAFSHMMTRVSRSDGHFGFSEQAFVKEILIMCEVPFVHK